MKWQQLIAINFWAPCRSPKTENTEEKLERRWKVFKDDRMILFIHANDTIFGNDSSKKGYSKKSIFFGIREQLMVLGNYAQGNFAQGNYAQTEITPEITEITRKLSYSKRIAAIIFRLLFEEVRLFVVWLGRFAPFAR